MSLKRFRSRIQSASMIVAALVLVFAGPGALPAQSLSGGGLVATIIDESGAPMRGVTVTLERGGSPIRILTTDRLGVVSLPLVPPGRYALLAEQIGYQPVRSTGVTIVSGGVSRMTVRLVRRPPPITTVDERPASLTISNTISGRVATADEMSRFDRWRDVTGAAGQFSEIDAMRDGRPGFAASGNGLAPRFSSLVVDGAEETLLRHPGMPGEPASAPAFQREAVQQVMIHGFATDGEWPNTLGSMLSAQTTGGGDRTIIRPWLSASAAKLGGRGIDNPGDSSATSIGGGLSLGGPIKRDTASWFIRFDYQQLKQPTAAPFAPSLAPGASADVAAEIGAAAATHGNRDVSPWISPTVRSWTGGSAMGRLDWRFGSKTALALRTTFASWNEDNPLVGFDASNGAGTKLEASDVSGVALLTTAGSKWVSETRFSLRTASRSWLGATTPYTGIAEAGAAIGSPDNFAGRFQEAAFGLAEAFTLRLGGHALKIGASATRRTDTYDWVPGSGGRFTFGDVASFAAGQGAFYQATRTGSAPDLTISDLSLYLQDTWQATPELQLLGGVRYDRDKLPVTGITLNIPWGVTSGFRNDLLPKDTKSSALGPHGGFIWSAGGSGSTVVRANVGLVPGRFDVGALAEVVQFDGDVRVRRATGAVAWPASGTDNTAAVVGPSLTFFGPEVRKPRAFKADFTLTHNVGAGMTMNVMGAYRHSDYLLRREDVNRSAGVATLDDGRTVWGSLQQYGGLITPAVGSNRRFTEFDMAYGLTSTGYVDYYEVTAAIDRRVLDGIDARLSYTYSRTTDNVPGALSSDVANRLSPFPTGLNSAVWEDGRSDFDIPHRIAATLQYTAAGSHPFSLGVRFRARSGLPFTPGFRGGVDVNGDGSGNNDPAFLRSTIPGVAELASANSCLASQEDVMAARNSCRDPGEKALDFRASLSLAAFGNRRLAFVLDGFNLVSSASGLRDHAALLVDPAGSITTNSAGHLVLPLTANTNFGQLLSRRNDARLLRLTVRVEN